MSDEKHTPGSWKAIGADVFAGRDCIAVCDTDNAPMARMEANARLISAAPDMLKALKMAERALAPFSKDPAEKSLMATMRAAISKAMPTIGAAVKKG